MKSKCFQKAGVLDYSLTVVSCVHEEQDPFSQYILVQNLTISLANFQTNVRPDVQLLSTIIINGEDIATCFDESNKTWEDEFLLSN